MSSPDLLYSRELPGGGYVAIEALSSDGAHPFRARISVERRADPDRRMGHEPPIVQEAEGPSREAVYEELVRVASDNVALAHMIRRWQLRRRAD